MYIKGEQNQPIDVPDHPRIKVQVKDVPQNTPIDEVVAKEGRDWKTIMLWILVAIILVFCAYYAYRICNKKKTLF